MTPLPSPRATGEAPTTLEPRAPGRRVLALGLGAVLGFTLLKGLVTLPHDWAISHHLLNYAHGFVKRGLPGTLLLPFFSGRDGATVRQMIIGVSFAVMTLFTVMAARAALGLVRGQALRRNDVAAAFLFASSAFVWHTAMCLGYFDALVAVLALLAVPGGRLGLLRFVPLAVVALAVHEVSAFLLVPVLLLLPLAPSRPGLAVDRGGAARVGAAIGVLAVASAFLFASRPSAELHARMLQWEATPPRWVDIVHELMNVPFRGQLERILAHQDMADIYLRGLIVLLPTTFIMMGLGLARLWRSGLERRARWLWAAVYTVASCSSLVLVLVAFDFARLFSLTHLQAFLAYTALRWRLGPDTGPARGGWALPAVAAVLVVANLLMPARFTFMEPRPRFLPDRVDAWLVDPLGSLADRLTR
ncbi:MAG TPA: hypothetical protein VE153_27475 [Myxococcus sp.]|nr:hypothetical protein [Myxococcus sp.]